MGVTLVTTSLKKQGSQNTPPSKMAGLNTQALQIHPNTPKLMHLSQTHKILRCFVQYKQ